MGISSTKSDSCTNDDDGEVDARQFDILSGSSMISNNNIEVVTRPWSDVPADLLSLIADRLGLIELLSFRGVCKGWQAAASTASAKIEASPHREPWFLLYGENSQCHLYNESGKRYIMSIPELDGATCIASRQGWLLMFAEGSLFFYCPFSHAKIDIPKFPHSILSDHAAAFSSPPTTLECIVAVMHREIEFGLELNVLYRGANTWTKHKLNSTQYNLSALGSAIYKNGTFHFFDKINGLVAFSVKDKSFVKYTIVKNIENPTNTPRLPYVLEKSRFVKNDMKKKVGLGEDVSVSICGTAVQYDRANKIIFSEDIDAAEESESRHLKGVWIQPRFFQVSPDQSW